MILACRSVQRAEESRDDIVKSTGNDDVIVMSLDLASLSSIKQFAEDFNRSEFPVHFVIIAFLAITANKAAFPMRLCGYRPSGVMDSSRIMSKAACSALM